MSTGLDKKTLRDQRFVIVFQLAVLMFMLVGLFSTLAFQPDSSKSEEIVDLNSIPLSNEGASETQQTLETVQIRAESAFIWDVKNQEVLYVKNPERILPLASITKLMTAMLAYELVAEDTIATVSLGALHQEGNSGLSEGESFTIEELSQLALISSSNGAAYELAASVGKLLGDKDPTGQFIRGMNIRAKELGLNTLNFKNTTGLDLSETEPGALGSAKDVSLLLAHILENYPEILDPTRKTSARIYNNDGSYHDAINTNDAVLAIPNLLASKTGYTDLAGGNLTIAFDAGLDRPIIITILGSTYKERFDDVLTLTKAIQQNL